MDFDSLLTFISEARLRHPLLFDLPMDATPDSHSLAEVEAALGAHLPEPYRRLLLELGGGDLAFGTVYSADPTSDLYILNNQRLKKDGYVEFSDDGTGNSYAFPVRDGRCLDVVRLLDHLSGDVSDVIYPTFGDFVIHVCLPT